MRDVSVNFVRCSGNLSTEKQTRSDILNVPDFAFKRDLATITWKVWAEV